ncbi:MAG: RNA polymerase sigma factor [bacterium]|nr:RNA polymerase sigma factor [bacterium]
MAGNKIENTSVIKDVQDRYIEIRKGDPNFEIKLALLVGGALIGKIAYQRMIHKTGVQREYEETSLGLIEDVRLAVEQLREINKKEEWKRIEPILIQTAAQIKAKEKDMQALAIESAHILYMKYSGPLHILLYRNGERLKQVREDIIQEALTRAFTHLDSYHDEGKFFGWLATISKNLLKNYYRSENRSRQIPLDAFDPDSLPEELFGSTYSDSAEQEAMRKMDRALLQRIVMGLSNDERMLVGLKLNTDLSNAEIGTIMGRTEGAIKSLYHRTVIRIGEEYQKN